MGALTRFFKTMPERCARVGFLPSGSYQASFGSAHLFCQGSSGFFMLWTHGIINFQEYAWKMRKCLFPPSGPYQASFGSARLFYHGFRRFYLPHSASADCGLVCEFGCSSPVAPLGPRTGLPAQGVPVQERPGRALISTDWRELWALMGDPWASYGPCPTAIPNLSGRDHDP